MDATTEAIVTAIGTGKRLTFEMDSNGMTIRAAVEIDGKIFRASTLVAHIDIPHVMPKAIEEITHILTQTAWNNNSH